MPELTLRWLQDALDQVLDGDRRDFKFFSWVRVQQGQFLHLAPPTTEQGTEVGSCRGRGRALILRAGQT